MQIRSGRRRMQDLLHDGRMPIFTWHQAYFVTGVYSVHVSPQRTKKNLDTHINSLSITAATDKHIRLQIFRDVLLPTLHESSDKFITCTLKYFAMFWSYIPHKGKAHIRQHFLHLLVTRNFDNASTSSCKLMRNTQQILLHCISNKLFKTSVLIFNLVHFINQQNAQLQSLCSLRD